MIGRGHLLLAVLAVAAACGNKPGNGNSSATAPKRTPLEDAVAMIDRELDALWQKAGVTPAPAAADEELLRRITLDLAGRIPTRDEVTAFLADTSPDKRQQVVDRLLASDDYAEHWGRVYADLLIGRRVRMSPKFPPTPVAWFEAAFRDGKPLDAMVRDLIAARGTMADNGAVGYIASNRLRGGSIETLAGNTARIFLGTQIQCAQCHDHPNDPRWKQQDFAAFAAFFAEVTVRRTDQRDAATTFIEDTPLGFAARPRAKLALRQPAPGFLHEDVAPAPGELRRDTLARMITDSPMFARVSVNRTWDRLFGRGLVDPWDDLGGKDDPRQPELLKVLADRFAASGYDHRWLVKVIVLSKAYGRASSGGSAAKDGDLEAVFARAAIRPLTADQLFRSQLVATGIEAAAGARMLRWKTEERKEKALRQYLFTFEDEEGQESDGFTGSVPQALLLRNGDLTNAGARALPGMVLGEILAAHPRPEDRIEQLFLACYARKPTGDELGRFADHVGKRGHDAAAYEDLFHAMLTSTEFVTNH